MSIELKEVTTAADWAALHHLRRSVLFTEARHPGVVYDPAHPADTNPAHTKLLLMKDGEPVGCTRLDPRPDGRVVVRLVAIANHLQRQGLGRDLERLALTRIRAMGAKKAVLNAVLDAVVFYEKCGWTREDWDPSELVGVGRDAVQMSKTV
jgi:predicted N-acetyltransferase YhbS